MYLYNKNSGQLIEQLNVESYKKGEIRCTNGRIISFGDTSDFELSSLPDLSETLIADSSIRNPSDSERIQELEALVAELFFGGEF